MSHAVHEHARTPAPKVPADLLEAARTAWSNAYVPYSKFRVGAALRADDGRIYAGANIENASFGLTRCAEQSAIQAMASAGQRGFSEIVVYTEAELPATPCGACRQILLEFSDSAAVYLVNHRGAVRAYRTRDLLPDGFRLEPA
ncbi:MAG TPA: cytidine deaminase [Trueperaceae bacterium]